MKPSPYKAKSDASPDTETRRPEANRPTTLSSAQGVGVILAVLLATAVIGLCCYYYFVRRHRGGDEEEGRPHRKINPEIRPPAHRNKELPPPPTSEGLSQGPSRKLQRNSTATTFENPISPESPPPRRSRSVSSLGSFVSPVSPCSQSPTDIMQSPLRPLNLSRK